MLLCVTFGKIVRKAVIATGGRGFQMTIIGHIGKKFDCLCQISGVYANNAASLFPTMLTYHFATAHILASVLCLRRKQVWHSYCAVSTEL